MVVNACEYQKPRMEVDFDGFCKEYAVDQQAAALKRQGIASCFVNSVGNVRVLGPKSDGAP